MRVLAAAFDDAADASSTLEELRQRYGLRPGDAAIAPLGSAEPSGERTVLAGRFDDEEVAEIRSLVAEHGGRVVSEVDESWTRSPTLHESLEPEPEPEQSPLR
jgi:hypothetical protein